MALLSAGHASVDACQGAIPALLPFLVPALDLNATEAAALVLAATVSSTVIQPIFGAWSDRIPAPWLLPGGVVLACIGVAAAAVAPSYPLVFLLVLISGLGVAAYHPEGSRFANYVSGRRRATGMSYFSLGGNVGFALGPLLVTPLLLALGLPGALAFLAPAAVMGTLLTREIPRLTGFQPVTPTAGTRNPVDWDDWRGFALLLAVICSRSFAFYTLLALIPLYFIGELGSSDATANSALTAMLACGAIGTLVGGRLADRIGRRPVVVASLAMQVPILVAITVADTPVAIALCAALGFVAVSSFSVTVVMAQEYLPTRVGLASGFSLGAAIGAGGLAAPVYGLIGDTAGLTTSMLTLALLPAVGALLALVLPLAPAPTTQAASPGAAPAGSARDFSRPTGGDDTAQA